MFLIKFSIFELLKFGNRVLFESEAFKIDIGGKAGLSVNTGGEFADSSVAIYQVFIFVLVLSRNGITPFVVV